MHFTYPNSDPHTSEASATQAVEAGAPEDEIEITPAMEIAGATRLCESYPEETGSVCTERFMAREVFLAMWRASRK
jgi:hypothetical protein